jgi:hypothetical protein
VLVYLSDIHFWWHWPFKLPLAFSFKSICELLLILRRIGQVREHSCNIVPGSSSFVLEFASRLVCTKIPTVHPPGSLSPDLSARPLDRQLSQIIRLLSSALASSASFVIFFNFYVYEGEFGMTNITMLKGIVLPENVYQIGTQVHRWGLKGTVSPQMCSI